MGIRWRLLGTFAMLGWLVATATAACGGSEPATESTTSVVTPTTRSVAEPTGGTVSLPTDTPSPTATIVPVPTSFDVSAPTETPAAPVPPTEAPTAVPTVPNTPTPVPTPTPEEAVPIKVAPVAVATIDPNATPTPVPTRPPTPTPRVIPTVSPEMLEAEGPDRAVLIALYNATNGSNWQATSNWLSNVPISEWSGVTTNGMGRVIELNLYARSLAGPIPPELGNLTYLRELILSSNQLTGSIPRELTRLTNLDELHLASPLVRPLTGCIPQELLEVPVNDLSGQFAPVCREIRGNASSDRVALVALYNATDGANWVNSHNWLSDAPISEWYGVETDADGRVIRLRLGNNQLTGALPAQLGELTSLGVLQLHSNSLTGPIPAELGNLTSLTVLHLGGSQLSGPIPPEIGNLTGLLVLDISNNQLRGPIPPEMGKLAYLRFLFMVGNQLSGAMPTELGNILYLAQAYIRDNQMDGCLPVEWQSMRPHNNDFELAGLPFCEGQPSMTSYSGDGAALAALYNAAGGENWLYSYKWLSDSPIGEWYGVTTDEEGRVIGLNLDGNFLSGELVPELGQLSNLVWLMLNGNRLGGEIPHELGELTHLRSVFLSGTELTGCIPAGLQDTYQAMTFPELTCHSVSSMADLGRWKASLSRKKRLGDSSLAPDVAGPRRRPLRRTLSHTHM